ncbi:MAG: hypothetical protein F4X64_00705 [Chloroflexi bacterium]|nr:hypothetical protein [Chloroflexota bacterium]
MNTSSLRNESDFPVGKPEKSVADMLAELDAGTLRELVDGYVKADAGLVGAVHEAYAAASARRAAVTDRNGNLVYAGQVISGDTAPTFDMQFTIWGQDEVQSRTLTGIVNAQKLYSIVPAQILDELGITRRDYVRFQREDGLVRQLGLGWAKLELQSKTSHTYIIFGDDPNETVIGSMTLIDFAFAADPDQKRLIPGVFSL